MPDSARQLRSLPQRLSETLPGPVSAVPTEAIATAEPSPESRLERDADATAPPLVESVGIAWRAFWTSRLVVLFAAVLAVLQIGRAAGTRGFDPSNLTAPFGYFGNLLASGFARWDSVWYLAIAHDGYGHDVAKTAFFPLYPLYVRGLGIVIGSELIAGVLISLIAFAVALVLLHRLARLDLDERAAETTIALIAFCPVAYFFSAVYTEGLYLALSVGCLLRARRGGWASAGLLGGLAAASRNSGVMLAVPVVILFLYGPRADHMRATSRWARRPFTGWRWVLPRHRLTPSILWTLLVPAGLGAYLRYLQLKTGNGLTPFHAQAVWFRKFHGPFGGVWTGAVAAWDGLRQLLHGPPPPLYFKLAGGDPMMVAGQNLMLFAFLALGLVGLVGVFRRLPFAYGAYALVSLAMPLSYPVTPQPLASLPRYEVVLFPLFMWAGVWLSRRRLTAPAIGVLAVLLGLFTAEFATWRFVA